MEPKENPFKKFQPVSLDRREGPYYGTRILDFKGDPFMVFWNHDDRTDPSEREREYRNTDTWTDWRCDEHWESVEDYDRAKAFIAWVNSL